MRRSPAIGRRSLRHSLTGLAETDCTSGGARRGSPRADRAIAREPWLPTTAPLTRLLLVTPLLLLLLLLVVRLHHEAQRDVVAVAAAARAAHVLHERHDARLDEDE